MKGHMKVKRLTKSGNYVSELGYDTAFAGEDNPHGYFKMVIQPIENEIRFMRTADGLVVSGEGYIISSGSESEIDENAKRYLKERWPGLVQREVKDEHKLW